MRGRRILLGAGVSHLAVVQKPVASADSPLMCAENLRIVEQEQARYVGRNVPHSPSCPHFVVYVMSFLDPFNNNLPNGISY